MYESFMNEKLDDTKEVIINLNIFVLSGTRRRCVPPCEPPCHASSSLGIPRYPCDETTE